MKAITILLLSLFALAAQGQIAIGIHADPSINFSQMKPGLGNEADSMKELYTPDKVVSLGLEIRKVIDRYQSVSFEPGYHQVNMLNSQYDLKFLDVIHPQLPAIMDLTYAATKNAYLHYRFQYASFGITYNNKLKAFYQNTGFNMEFRTGLHYLYLANHDVKVKTEGFAINGSFVQFVEDTTGIIPNKHLANLSLNYNVNYQLIPSVELSAGLQTRIPLIANADDPFKLTIYNIGLHLGIRKEFY